MRWGPILDSPGDFPQTGKISDQSDKFCMRYYIKTKIG